jgi:hypothetical protein
MKERAVRAAPAGTASSARWIEYKASQTPIAARVRCREAGVGEHLHAVRAATSALRTSAPMRRAVTRCLLEAGWCSRCPDSSGATAA